MERHSGSGAQRKPKAEGGAGSLRKTLWQTRPHPKQKVTLEEFRAGCVLKVIITKPKPCSILG